MSDERDLTGSSSLQALTLFFLNRLFIPAGKVLMNKASSFFTIESNKGPAAARTVDSF
jgi:hypothetical protein